MVMEVMMSPGLIPLRAAKLSRSTEMTITPAAVPALNCRVYRTADGRVSPLPDRGELASRLREALARPWDLPGWVDPRKETS